MDLAKLKLFTTIAEHGSLTKAAIAVGSVPSALSRQIAALERDCGGRLFYRNGRGVTLTELGQRILSRVRPLLAGFEQLSTEIRANAGVPMGEVRVGLLPSFSHPLINRLYQATRASYPGIRLYIIEGSTGQLDEWVASGNVDMAVMFRYGKGEVGGEQPLTVVDTYLVGPMGDEVTRTPTVKFTQIDKLPLILPGLPNGLRVILDQIARKRNVTLSVAMEVNSLSIAKDVVAEGGGYAILAEHAVMREIQAGVLQGSRIISPRIDRIVTLGMTSHRPATLASREVARLICKIVEGMSDSRELPRATSTRSQKKAAR